MCSVARDLWIGCFLLASAAGCGEVGEQIAVQVDRIEARFSGDAPIKIAVDARGACRVDDGESFTLTALTGRMERRARNLKQADLDPGQITVRVSVDDQTAYAKFARLVDVCHESGFFKFEVMVGERAFPFDLSPVNAKLADNGQSIPLKLRLRAREDGSLARLSLNDRQLAAAIELQAEMVALIGSDRGPGSIHELLQVEIVCDDELKFCHLADVYRVVSGYQLDDGSRVTLAENIWPVTGRPEPEFDGIELVEELALQPIDLETIESIEVGSVSPNGFTEVPTGGVPELAAGAQLPTANFGPALRASFGDAGVAGQADSTATPVPQDKAGDDKTADDKAAVVEADPAVAAALQWLVEHQAADGSWSFDHRKGECNGRCRGAGDAARATNAATAMALLPFLAAGQTHQQGEHQMTVLRGIANLLQSAKHENDTVSFAEPMGTMYSHGLATIALCEVYRQTKDEQFKEVCQLSLDYIDFAQDPVGGGWRYVPRQPGDTSVSGWQVAALKSGQLAGLTVPDKTTQGASRFLDHVQSDQGARYGYVHPSGKLTTSAVGLVSRIHLGWQRDHEAWQRGTANLAKTGPSRSDAYFNYYATQALAQRGGEPWTAWETSMGDFLRKEQATDGHQKGSWYMGAGHSGSRGGRLYSTALCALTLQVGHRQLGIFQTEAAKPAENAGD